MVPVPVVLTVSLRDVNESCSVQVPVLRKAGIKLRRMLHLHHHHHPSTVLLHTGPKFIQQLVSLHSQVKVAIPFASSVSFI